MDAILYEVLNQPTPFPVLLVSEEKIHVAYIDHNGHRFTQERCNLDDAGVLITYDASNVIGVAAGDLKRCERCFRG